MSEDKKAVKTPKTTKAPAIGGTPTAKTSKQDALALARAARSSQESKDVFIYSGKLAEGAKKLAPQAQVIVNTIQAAGKDGIVRTALVTALRGVLVTRQPESRILGYYQKDLEKDGHVTIVRAKAPEAEPTTK